MHSDKPSAYELVFLFRL